MTVVISRDHTERTFTDVSYMAVDVTQSFNGIRPIVIHLADGSTAIITTGELRNVQE